MGDMKTDKPLVVIFHAGDPELLPIAEAALEKEGIEYLIRAGGGGVPVGFGHTAEFGGAEGTADILVNAADADRASAVLADLALAPGAPFELAPLAPEPAAWSRRGGAGRTARVPPHRVGFRRDAGGPHRGAAPVPDR